MASSITLAIALLFFLVGFYWLILKSSSERIVAQYKALAEKLGLELNTPTPLMYGLMRPEPSLYGELDGREVSLSVPGKGLQNTRQIETVLKVQLKDKAFTAQVAASGILVGFRQRDGRGLERWKSGDSDFDAAWDIRTKPGLDVSAVFDEANRARIAELLKAGKGSLYFGGGVMAYAELGLISKGSTRERYEEIIEFLSELAATIEKS